MNEQKPSNAIEWTRVRKPDGMYTKGFTWNVVGGCEHACQWEMPNGEIAECYAKTVAERVAQAAYPNGFASHYWHPERLVEPGRVKEPAGIFIDSMADLMGHWVPDEQIQQVLDVCRQVHWHTFFLLTKNAPRLAKFEFPPNVWVGASSPPDWMFGKRLTRDQQSAMLHRTLKTLQEVKAKVRWISFEPLSWDCSDIVKQYPGALTWAVIGAASNGRVEYPPSETDLLNMLVVLDEQNVPIFFKGNMRTLPMTANDWRHEFPDELYKPRKTVTYAGYNAELPDTDWGHSTPFQPYTLEKPEPPKPTSVVSFHDVKAHWNRETQSWDNPDYVYIGRANPTHNLAHSRWANPFKLSQDTPQDREEALILYRGWVTKQIFFKELETLRGKTLVCWCKDKAHPDRACHGDVLLDLLGESKAKQEQPEQPKQLTLFDMARHFD